MLDVRVLGLTETSGSTNRVVNSDTGPSTAPVRNADKNQDRHACYTRGAGRLFNADTYDVDVNRKDLPRCLKVLIDGEVELI